MELETLRMFNHQYGCKTYSSQPVTPGWSALAYQIVTDQGDFFLKAYEKDRPTAKSWIERIDYYMPLLIWLNERERLKGRIVCPKLTTQGQYRWEDDCYIYLAFEMIDGYTISESRISNEQLDELASLLATLHIVGKEAPMKPDFLFEDFETPFHDSLLSLLSDSGTAADLTRTWKPYRERIKSCTKQMVDLAEQLRNTEHSFVLCHTDIHGWNLMQAKNLVLIDWEGLRFAPAEADLFAFTKNFFFDYRWDIFIEKYKNYRLEYRPNDIAMEFYRIRRRLEDIHDFAASLLYDGIEGEARSVILKQLSFECTYL